MTALAVLAAGEGTRFLASGGASPKVLAAVGGDAMVTRAVRAALAADAGPVVVVEGAVPLAAPVIPEGAEVVRNDRWGEGMATSLQVAVEWARRGGHDALVVGLADQPGVVAEAWRRVAACTARPVAIATYDGTRGHPVRLAASVWDELPSSGDAGARALVQGPAELVAEVPCPGAPHDVDTQEDLDRWS